MNYVECPISSIPCLMNIWVSLSRISPLLVCLSLCEYQSILIPGMVSTLSLLIVFLRVMLTMSEFAQIFTITRSFFSR